MADLKKVRQFFIDLFKNVHFEIITSSTSSTSSTYLMSRELKKLLKVSFVNHPSFKFSTEDLLTPSQTN